MPNVAAQQVVTVAPAPVDDDVATVDKPYAVILWNDPVTLMDLVVRILSKVFGYPATVSERLMMTAHAQGKVAVWTGARHEAVRYCVTLGTHGLQATVAEA